MRKIPFTALVIAVSVPLLGGAALAAAHSVSTQPAPAFVTNPRVAPTDDPASHDANDDNGVDDPDSDDVNDDNGMDDPATHDVNDDNGMDDPATHDVNDDNGGGADDGSGHDVNDDNGGHSGSDD